MSGYGWTEADLARHMAKVGKPTSVTERVIQIADKHTKAAKRQKYNAQKTVTTDGVRCDSKAEAARWEELRLMEKARQIRMLLPHPSFPLYVNGTRTGRMTFDAMYLDVNTEHMLVLEDTKSPITAKATAYRQRLRQFQACYPHITVREHIPSKVDR